MSHHEYYIGIGEESKGPFDLIMLVRKIRNGSLTEDTPIHLGNQSEAQPAIRWVELIEFFKEKTQPAEPAQLANVKTSDFIQVISRGWNFLNEHTSSTLFSAIIVLLSISLVTVIYLLVPFRFQAVLNIAAFLFSYALLNCYILTVQRMTRGQSVDILIVYDRISLHFKTLFTAGVLTALPATAGLAIILLSDSLIVSFLGLVIVIIPGILWITLNAYTALLVMDKNMPITQAMQISYKTIAKSGIENIGIVYGLFALNFIGGLIFLLPLVITLPVTMSGITSMYDENLADLG